MIANQSIKSRLIESLLTAARTTVGSIGKDAVIVVGINFTTRNQCSNPKIVVNVATVQTDNATAARVGSIGSIVCELRNADSNYPSTAISKHAISGIAGEVTMQSTQARVNLRVYTVTVAIKGAVYERSPHLSRGCARRNSVAAIVLDN
jgi:hypothetical protein